ncbi:unnamed protein product [Urochloa humidicola]
MADEQLKAEEGMADWSSLPSDLINRVAARFLATNDLDHYTDFRAVCRSWRSSTADPRTTATANDDPRFRPRRWVILDEVKSASGMLRHTYHHHDRDTRLFVNAATGRFLRRSLPLLRGYYHVTTTPGGFLVLADRKPPHAARVLNPFTGAMARFRAPMPRETYLAAAAVTGSFTLTLVLACNASGRLYWADPESEAFLFQTCNIGFPSGLLPLLASEYAGRKHGSAVTDTDEATNKMVDPVRSSAQLEHRTVAVSSTTGGETETLLLVTLDLDKSNHLVQVRKRPAASSAQEAGVLEFEEQVTSIGNNALFVGDRCLLVDADKLPSVDANCVYYYQLKGPDEFIFRYDLDAGKAERIAISPRLLLNGGEHPHTIIQLLVNYTMNGPSYELMRDEMLQGIPEDICPADYDLDYDEIFSEFGD